MVDFWRVLVVCVLLTLTVNILVRLLCSIGGMTSISGDCYREKRETSTLEANVLALAPRECNDQSIVKPSAAPTTKNDESYTETMGVCLPAMLAMASIGKTQLMLRLTITAR